MSRTSVGLGTSCGPKGGPVSNAPKEFQGPTRWWRKSHRQRRSDSTATAPDSFPRVAQPRRHDDGGDGCRHPVSRASAAAAAVKQGGGVGWCLALKNLFDNNRLWRQSTRWVEWGKFCLNDQNIPSIIKGTKQPILSDSESIRRIPTFSNTRSTLSFDGSELSFEWKKVELARLYPPKILFLKEQKPGSVTG